MRASTVESRGQVWLVALLGVGAGAVLLLGLQRARGSVAIDTASAAVNAEAADTGERELELVSELTQERERSAGLQRELDELRAEFGIAQRQRVDRELEFLHFTRAVAEIDLDSPRMRFTKELLSEEPGALPEPVVPEEPDPEQLRRQERSEQLARDLKALMRAEWVHGFDLIEPGLVSSEGWLGPVVFRLLDDRGRLTGSLSAERLRLEGSISGRVVTIVLEDGQESSGGLATPFRSGVRRISLPGVDPKPWIEALPELFEVRDGKNKDDGLWNLTRVREQFNRRLAEDATGDVYRLRHLGGVIDGVLRDVYFSITDRNGSVLRHLFADRCRIQGLERGILVQLEDGVTIRGDSRSPFLEGRYRIFLPRARMSAWERAKLPGLHALEEVDTPPTAAKTEEESGSNGDSVGNRAP